MRRRLLTGNGIGMVGTHNNHVEHNLVVRSRNDGIMCSRFWTDATGLRPPMWFADNTVFGSVRADFAVGGFGTMGNCFSGNIYRTSLPLGVAALNGCGRWRLPIASDLSGDMPSSARLLRFSPAGLRERLRARPVPPQSNMPGGADAPVRPALMFRGAAVDMDSIKTPAESAATVIPRSARAEN